MHFFKYLVEREPAEYDRKKMFTKDFEPLIKASNKKFEPLLKDLVKEYHKLPTEKKNKVKEALKNNANIKSICDKKVKPVMYKDFQSKFSKKLKAFEEKLWKEYEHNNTIKSSCGTVKQHFDAFVKEDFQKAIICPFCGLNALKPSGGEYRDAYDHYLPKALFPFISVHFKNLAPTCHDCNSNEKRAKPVIYQKTNTKDEPRKVYYPFDSRMKHDNLVFKIVPTKTFNTKSKSTLLSNLKWNYEVKKGGTKDSRLGVWEDIYRVQGRYKERMPQVEKEWFEWIKDSFKEAKEDSVPFNKFVKRRLDETKKQIMVSEKGLMRHSYVEYILTLPKIEEKLELLVK